MKIKQRGKLELTDEQFEEIFQQYIYFIKEFSNTNTTSVEIPILGKTPNEYIILRINRTNVFTK